MPLSLHKEEIFNLRVDFQCVSTRFLDWYDVCMDIDMSIEHDIIRHPVEIPLQVKTMAGDFCNQPDYKHAGCVELAFHFPMMISVGALLSVCIPSINEQEEIHGQVTWLAHSAHGFVIGMSFQNEREAFRMRMLEQLCYIEDYRQHILTHEGRSLSQQQAASEWIDRHAAAFPLLHTNRTH